MLEAGFADLSTHRICTYVWPSPPHPTPPHPTSLHPSRAGQFASRPDAAIIDAPLWAHWHKLPLWCTVQGILLAMTVLLQNYSNQVWGSLWQRCVWMRPGLAPRQGRLLHRLGKMGLALKQYEGQRMPLDCLTQPCSPPAGHTGPHRY